MDLHTTIEVNKQIMALIKSKYPIDFPLAYHNAEATYYNNLMKTVLRVERFAGEVPGWAPRTAKEVIEGAGARIG